MHSLYGRVAGKSVERPAVLSHGIFAVSMTLLVLDLRVCTGDAIHSERVLWNALLAPETLVFEWRSALSAAISRFFLC